MKAKNLKMGDQVQLKAECSFVVTVIAIRPRPDMISEVVFDGVVIQTDGPYKVGKLETGFDPVYFRKFKQKEDEK